MPVRYSVFLFLLATGMMSSLNPTDGFAPSAAFAQTSDEVITWATRRVGGKICMAEHEHFGESPPWTSKSGARAYAIRNWEASTVGEYGPRWRSYRLAAGKRMSCRAAGKRWVCATTARPCRRVGRR